MSWINKNDLINLLEAYAPKEFAAEGDNTGIQIGELEGEIEKCFVTLDVTRDVINESVTQGVKLIIAHHPLVREPVKRLTPDEMGETAYKALTEGITVYTCHTNLDAALDIGVNTALTERLELNFSDHDILYLTHQKDYYKIVVYTPKDYEDKISQAMVFAGAGGYGTYSGVTFNNFGTGTFFPSEGAKPYIGIPGKKQQVEESKIEAMVDYGRIHEVMEAVKAVHPYEVPVIDVYPLEEPKDDHGLGWVGDLKEAWRTEKLLDQIENKLSTSVSVSGEVPHNIKRVALCGGSGGKLIPQVLKHQADIFITGDLKYHEALDASENGLFLVDAGHRETELPVVDKLTDFIYKKLGQGINTKIIPFYNKEQILKRRF